MTNKSENNTSENLEEILEETSTSQQKKSLVESIKDKWFTKIDYNKRFTCPFIGIIEVPQGSAIVKYKFGQTNGFRIPIISPIKEIAGAEQESRIFKGYTKEPGFRLLFGFGGLYESARGVNTQLRTSDYNTKPDANLVTDDGVELLGVDYTVNWRVINPLIAVTEVKNYKETLREITEARIRRIVGSFNFNDLSRISSQQIRGPYTKKNKETTIKLEDINDEYNLKENLGIKIETMMLTQFEIPEELKKALAKAAIGKATAQANIEIAASQREIAEENLKAAEIYDQNPTAMELRKIRVIEKMAEGNNKIIYDSKGLLSKINL